MMRRLAFLVSGLALLVSSTSWARPHVAAPSQGNPPGLRAFADPAELGPYGVGVMEVMVIAPNESEPLETLVWYPADIPPGAAPYVYIEDPDLGGPLTSLGVQDAAVHNDPEPYPVVAFSHGNGGINCQSIFLTEHLASHGYVVISANHPGNTLYDYHPTSLVTGIWNRPQDISALLDWIYDQNRSSSSPLYQHLNTARTGMTGHSFGGYTTLAVSGARINLNPPTERCLVTGDPLSCLMVKSAPAHRPGDLLIDLSDRRVITSVPLAPWGWEPFRAEGLSYINIPIQIQGGELDDTCPYDTQQVPVYDNVSGPRSLLDIYDAGHYMWSDYCLAFPDFDECYPPYIDMEEAHTIINTYVLSHFKVYLDGDTRYSSYLSTSWGEVNGEGVWGWQEELGL